jgi:hypothetical protein
MVVYNTELFTYSKLDYHLMRLHAFYKSCAVDNCFISCNLKEFNFCE